MTFSDYIMYKRRLPQPSDMSGYSEKEKVIADFLDAKESLLHNDVTIKSTVDNQELMTNKFVLCLDPSISKPCSTDKTSRRVLAM